MSVDISFVPPWKQALIEKKRRQEEDNRRKQDSEVQRFSQMPSWKRDILLKKQQQKNSVVFISKPLIPEKPKNDNLEPPKTQSSKSSSSSSEVFVDNHEAVDSPPPPQPLGVDESDNNGEVQPHIIPITQNPLLRKDPETLNKVIRSHKHYSYPGANTDYDGSGSGHVGHSCSAEPDGPAKRHSANCDDVFIQEEEEVTYGRGFVHKLLKRFSHMSTKDENDKLHTLPRRASSSENILDDKLAVRGYSSYGRAPPLSPSRTRSSESLSSGHQMSPRSNSSAENSFSHENNSCSHDNNSVNSDHVMPNNTSQLEEVQLSHRSKSPEPESSILNRSSSSENVGEDLPRPNIVRTARSVFENILPLPTRTYDTLQKRRAPDIPSASDSKAGISNNVGKYYNDTLSRKAGSTVRIADEEDTVVNGGEPMVNGHDAGDHTHDSGTPPVLDTAIQSIQSAGKSWYFSGGGSGAGSDQQRNSSTGSSVMSPPTVPKNSFLYPAVKSPDALKAKPTYPNKPVIKPRSPEVKLDKPRLPASKPDMKQRSPDPKPDTKLRNGNNNVSNGIQLVNGDQKRTAPTPPSPASIQIDHSVDESTTDATDDTDYQPQPIIDIKPKSKPERPNLNLNLNHLHKEAKNDANDTVTNINNLKNQLKKTKRLAPAGPGSMLIRPASNLVVGATKTEYLNLSKYNDVKIGEFAPAKKRPSYYDTYDDDEDVPVTNIDDVLSDDVPITNIDDVALPRADANDNIVKRKKYDFVGANVKLERNLLQKTRNSKKVSFNVYIMFLLKCLICYCHVT